MAPGDEHDLEMMIPWALSHDHPTAIRYPKAGVARVPRHAESGELCQAAPVELGEAEVVRHGCEGVLIAYGSLLHECVAAAEELGEEGTQWAVINARFVKPLDTRTILEAVRQQPLVVTVEEGCLMGGFGSAVLEAANDAGLDTSHVRRLGVPDQYIEHADRSEQLASLRLSGPTIAETCRKLAGVRHISARPSGNGRAVSPALHGSPQHSK